MKHLHFGWQANSCLSLSFSVLAQNGERAEKSIRISIQSQDEEGFDIIMDRSHQATKLEY